MITEDIIYNCLTDMWFAQQRTGEAQHVYTHHGEKKWKTGDLGLVSHVIYRSSFVKAEGTERRDKAARLLRKPTREDAARIVKACRRLQKTRR